MRWVFRDAYHSMPCKSQAVIAVWMKKIGSGESGKIVFEPEQSPMKKSRKKLGVIPEKVRIHYFQVMTRGIDLLQGDGDFIL